MSLAEAEDAAFGGTAVDRLLDRADLERRVAAVLGSEWWAASGPPVAIRRPRRDARSSTARCRRDNDGGDLAIDVALTDPQLTLATAAHELAHALAGVEHGHDRLFCAAYLDVVAVLVGSDAAGWLNDAFGAFDLPVDVRRWPSPWRHTGSTFRTVP